MLPLVAYIDQFSIVLTLIVGMFKVRQMEQSVKYFFMLFILGAVVEAVTLIMAFRSENTLWLIQCYQLANFVVISFILIHWQKRNRLTTIAKLLPPIFSAFWILAKLTFEPLTGHDQYTSTVASLFFIFIASRTLFHMSQHENTDGVHNTRFWITAGVILYSSGNLILLSVFQWFTFLPLGDALLIWQFHWGLDACVNFIYAFGFSRLKR